MNVLRDYIKESIPAGTGTRPGVDRRYMFKKVYRAVSGGRRRYRRVSAVCMRNAAMPAVKSAASPANCAGNLPGTCDHY